MEKQQENTFVQGKILQPLIVFALPVLFALFLQAMYGAVDLLIASIARAVWFVNHIYCTFAHQMYTLPCYRTPDSSSILFIFCCNGGCALSGASSGKAV